MELIDKIFLTNFIVLICLYIAGFYIGEKQIRICIKDKNIPVSILLFLILCSIILMPVFLIAKIWI